MRWFVKEKEGHASLGQTATFLKLEHEAAFIRSMFKTLPDTVVVCASTQVQKLLGRLQQLPGVEQTHVQTALLRAVCTCASLPSLQTKVELTDSAGPSPGAVLGKFRGLAWGIAQLKTGAEAQVDPEKVAQLLPSGICEQPPAKSDEEVQGEDNGKLQSIVTKASADMSVIAAGTEQEAFQDCPKCVQKEQYKTAELQYTYQKRGPDEPTTAVYECSCGQIIEI